jgi:hypothetical protein
VYDYVNQSRELKKKKTAILETTVKLEPHFYEKMYYYADGVKLTQYFYKKKLHHVEDLPAEIIIYPKYMNGEDLVNLLWYQNGKLKSNDRSKPAILRLYGNNRVDICLVGSNYRNYLEKKYIDDILQSSKLYC